MKRLIKKSNLEIGGLGKLKKGEKITENSYLEGIEMDGVFYDVICFADRPIIKVNLNGVTVPFYVTTGYGGKGLKSGWYVVWGLDTQTAWFNKGEGIADFYEEDLGEDIANELRKISQILGEIYGTNPEKIVRELEKSKNKQQISEEYDVVDEIEEFKDVIDAVNKGLVVGTGSPRELNAADRLDIVKDFMESENKEDLLNKYIEEMKETLEKSKQNLKKISEYFHEQDDIYITYKVENNAITIILNLSKRDSEHTNKKSQIYGEEYILTYIEKEFKINVHSPFAKKIETYDVEPTDNILLVIESFEQNEEINSKTEDEQIEILTEDISQIRYIKNPSEKVQMFILEKDDKYLKHIDNLTESVQVAAVDKRFGNYFSIKNPSDFITMRAIEQDPVWNIEYIDSLSESVQLQIIEKYPNWVWKIQNPCQQVKDYLKSERLFK